jgi:hypothetical protein
MSTFKSVSGVEEIHDISRKLEEEYYRKQNSNRPDATQPILADRITAIEAQIIHLHNQNRNILEHLREISEFLAEHTIDTEEE